MGGGLELCLLHEWLHSIDQESIPSAPHLGLGPFLDEGVIIFSPSPLGVQGRRGQGTEQTFHCSTQNTLGDAQCPPPPSYVSRWVTPDSLCKKERASLLLTPLFTLPNTSQPLLLLSDLYGIIYYYASCCTLLSLGLKEYATSLHCFDTIQIRGRS